MSGKDNLVNTSAVLNAGEFKKFSATRRDGNDLLLELRLENGADLRVKGKLSNLNRQQDAKLRDLLGVLLEKPRYQIRTIKPSMYIVGEQAIGDYVETRHGRKYSWEM